MVELPSLLRERKGEKNASTICEYIYLAQIGNLDAQMKAGGNQDKHRPAATQDDLWFALVVLSKVVCESECERGLTEGRLAKRTTAEQAVGVYDLNTSGVIT